MKWIQSVVSCNGFIQWTQSMDSRVVMFRLFSLVNQWVHSMNSIREFNQCIQSMDSFNGFMQWAQSMDSFHGFIQWTHSIYSFNGFIQWTYSVDSFNVFNQWIHTTDSINGFMQWTHSILLGFSAGIISLGIFLRHPRSVNNKFRTIV